jgi:putative ABC transport system permease protein
MKSKAKIHGLYYLLGLSLFDLVKISVFAKVWNFLFSMIGGILTGIIFSKAGVLLLGKMLNVYNLTLSIHLQPIMQVILLFLLIFFMLFLINIWMVYKVSPIDLLHAQEVGEKEPKSR